MSCNEAASTNSGVQPITIRENIHMSAHKKGARANKEGRGSQDGEERSARGRRRLASGNDH